MNLEVLATATHIQPHQKTAMYVLAIAKRDIEDLLHKDQSKMRLDLRQALADALRLLLLDDDNLKMWCTIAGWPWEAVRRQSAKLVQGVDWKRLLEPKRRIAGAAVRRTVATKAALYYRAKKDKERESVNG